METIKNYFLVDARTLLGRSIRHFFRSRHTMITVTIIILSIAFMLALLVYVFGYAIQILEETFF